MSDVAVDIVRTAKAMSAEFVRMNPSLASMAAVMEYQLAAAIVRERRRCVDIAKGFERNRDWVPGSLYETLRREVAAAILHGEAA